MLASFLLTLREGLEAALIIGIALGALSKIRRDDLKRTLWLGVAAAALVSIIAALLLTALGLELEDPGEAIFEGFTMLLAAGILTWMIFWMSRQSRTLKAELESGISKAAASTGKNALFWLAFIAVVREGIELALFLTAAFFAGNSSDTAASAVQIISGGLLGLFTAILLGWTLFASTVRLDLRSFFQVTGFLLILFGAGLVAHGVHEFIEVGWLPAFVEHLWDMTAIISEESLLGQLLTTLFGYNPSPALTEVLAYAAYLLIAFFGTRLTDKTAERAISQPQA